MMNEYTLAAPPKNLAGKKEEQILEVIENLKLNGLSKRKIAFSMRNSMEKSKDLMRTTYHEQGSIQNKTLSQERLRLPNIQRQKNLEQKIKELKLKKIESITKTYLKDYTLFNYKIDKVLNEAYGFIKNHQR
mmetsp:Transcript_4967/g.4563  ORF Transcript_4967/g.4563 Transcript_4967/m.4563 type:complete len:132 (-) Transcript_4967:61-456(-)